MATVKVFDSLGVKTLILMGNAMDQDYDPIEEMDETDDIINSMEPMEE